MISRALVEIFSHPVLHDALAFRGRTALHKLHLAAARYSEDIDLVQPRPEGAGLIIGTLRAVLDPCYVVRASSPRAAPRSSTASIRWTIEGAARAWCPVAVQNAKTFGIGGDNGANGA